MKSFTNIFIWGIFLTSVACDVKETIPKPKNLIPEETYVNIMLELHILDSWVFTSTDSTFSDSITTKLFDFYNIDKQQFISSHTYYQSQIDGQISRIDSALKLLRSEQILHDPSLENQTGPRVE